MKLSWSRPKLGAPGPMKRRQSAAEPLVEVRRAARAFESIRARESPALAPAPRERARPSPRQARPSPRASAANIAGGGLVVALDEHAAPVAELGLVRLVDVAAGHSVRAHHLAAQRALHRGEKRFAHHQPRW